MAKAKFTSVDEYMESLSDDTRATLQRVRKVVRKAVPGAKEVISYQIPALDLNGQCVIYFAGWTKHYSIYPANARLVAAFKEELAPYPRSKGTVRFPLSEPVPAKLIERMAKFLAKEAAERAKAKAAAKSRRR